uniref:Solute carrier family 26 member 4 n=1 Tax=Electrophorus electricus TaxID=8005 RepID=A0A4W4DS31_ELEEL
RLSVNIINILFITLRHLLWFFFSPIGLQFMHLGNGSAMNGTPVDSETIYIHCVLPISQLGTGVLHVGFLVQYLSDQLVGGFTMAAAFHVLISQLRMVLSVPTHSHSGLFSIAYTLADVFQNINQTNMADLVAGLLAIATVMAEKEVNTKFQHKISVPIPIDVIVTVVATGISYAVKLNSHYGASIIHTIPRGQIYFPNIVPFGDIVGSSFSTAVVGYAVSVSVAKVYAEKHDYKIDAFGISNIFCGAFSGFIATAALSCTAIQESTEGKTQVAGLISVVVLIVILVLGPLLQPLQKSVLAGIVIANLKGMFLQISNVPILWRQKTDLSTGIWVFTCIACILLGLDVGLLTGVVFELGMVIPFLFNILGTDIYKNMKDYKQENINCNSYINIDEIPRINIFRCNSSTYFANINYFKEQLRDAVRFDAVQVFKKRNKALKKIHELIKRGTPVELLGVDNEAFEREQDTELVEGEFQQDLEGGASPDTEVEVQVDWTFMLPVNVNVPRVNIHSLVMDFSAVSFLDVMAAKSLKLVIKEFIAIGVSVFPSVTDETVGRMEAMSFFDEVITRNMLFLSAHDAILFIKLKASSGNLPC